MDRVKTFLPIGALFALLAVACGGGSSSAPATDSKPPYRPRSHRRPSGGRTSRLRRRRASPACRLTPYRRAPTRTMSRPRPMAASGTPRRPPASSAGSTRATGASQEIALGDGSAPHGVIVGPDGAPGSPTAARTPSCASTRDQRGQSLTRCRPTTRLANLNTAVFDNEGQFWFTGQSGVYGRLEPASRRDAGLRRAARHRPLRRHGDARRRVYFASLAGSYLGHIDPEDGQATRSTRRPPDQARAASGRTRRAASGSANGTPASWRCTTRRRRVARMEAARRAPQAYAVYVDDRTSLAYRLRRQRASSASTRAASVRVFPLPSRHAHVRQLLGRPGEVWGAESATDSSSSFATNALASPRLASCLAKRSRSPLPRRLDHRARIAAGGPRDRDGRIVH